MKVKEDSDHLRAVFGRDWKQSRIYFSGRTQTYFDRDVLYDTNA